jgi:ubiquinone/menaquinone biosynthesis C-methylase UbiE
MSLWSMNRRHSRLTDWGLEHVAVRPRDVILDVGCGGGRTVSKLATMAREGKVYGVDIAPAAAAYARKNNREWIESGGVAIVLAPVQALPFPSKTFDLVTAVETHFWWEDLGGGLREIARALKPGGRLLIIAEFYNGGRHARYAARLSQLSGMASLTSDEHGAALADAGFTHVVVDEDAPKGWLSVLGERAASTSSGAR